MGIGEVGHLGDPAPRRADRAGKPRTGTATTHSHVMEVGTVLDPQVQGGAASKETVWIRGK